MGGPDDEHHITNRQLRVFHGHERGAHRHRDVIAVSAHVHCLELRFFHKGRTTAY